MKIMRILAILSVFISSLTPLFAQDNDLDRGNAILKQNNVNTKCRVFFDTPDGIYIGTRTAANYKLIYRYKNDSLSLVKSLDSYVIFGYSESTNSLVVGTKPKDSPFTDVTSTQIFKYNLDSHKLIKLADYGINGYSGIYKVNLNGDTLICKVNSKRTGKNEVGSDLIPQTIILN
jgi:hypothetical protein